MSVLSRVLRSGEGKKLKAIDSLVPDINALEPEIEKICIDACKTLRLRFAGVDLLESNRGPLLMEVNSSPGLEGIERATGVDIANEVIREIERMCD